MSNHVPTLPKPVLIIGAVVAVLLVAGALAAFVVSNAVGGGSSTVEVVYEVASDGHVDVTYGALKSAQQTDEATPWSYTEQVDRSEAKLAGIVAQAGDGATQVGCKITVDGKVTAVNISTGAFAVVTC